MKMQRTLFGLPLQGKWLVAGAALLGVIAIAVGVGAAPVKGRVTGFMKLLNPVWAEFKKPDSHAYTFREPSPTVKAEYRKLFPYIPKEVCVALVGTTPQPKMQKVSVKIGGGRTTPVTLVVTPGTEIHFQNTDPFPHRLYAEDVKTFGAGDTKPGGERIWTVPAAGVYEIRDELVPSVRTWIVAEPNVVAFGFPDTNGAFTMELPTVGEFKVQAYFTGQVVGASPVMNITRPNALVDLSKAPIQLTPPKGAPGAAAKEGE